MDRHRLQNLIFFWFQFITLAIIFIGLMYILVPAYELRLRRDYYGELVRTSWPYVIAVEDCYLQFGDLGRCNTGEFGIPPEILPKQHYGAVYSLTVNKGEIVITPLAQYGILPSDLYILSPILLADKTMVWNVSGDGFLKGYARVRRVYNYYPYLRLI